MRSWTHLCDLPAFVVTSNECDPIRIPHLERQQQEEGLHTVKSAIHEVTHEEIVRLGTFTAHAKQLHEVVELRASHPSRSSSSAHLPRASFPPSPPSQARVCPSCSTCAVVDAPVRGCRRRA
eukprot:scaffold945_cov382-Pavlova_lutheri.AAC.3